VTRRLTVGVLIAFVASLLIFVAVRVLPGDGAQALLGRNANPVALDQLRHELGLDRPAPAQYTSWLAGVATGDLGTSFASRTPVTQLLAGRTFNTIVLAGLAMLVIVPVSLALGTLSGIRRGRPLDHAISTGTLAAVALPEFVTGTVLASVIAVSLGLLPPVSLLPTGDSPLSHPEILVLPILTLAISGVAANSRMVRAGVAAEMDSDYVETARLNGLPEGRIVGHHVLRNALAPTVQTFALTAQYLVSGVIVVEAVFQYPGLGSSLVAAVGLRDVAVVQSLGFLIALAYIFLNVAADICVVLLIPRLRTTV
jgi:peptide/nickel transport system permease protein